MSNYLIFIDIKTTDLMLKWLGMTFLENVIPCQLSRLSQHGFIMSFWHTLHGLINRYDFLIKSHTVYLILTWADMTLWMSYRLLVSDIHWYDLIKSYRVIHSGIWQLCVWLAFVWLEKVIPKATACLLCSKSYRMT